MTFLSVASLKGLIKKAIAKSPYRVVRQSTLAKLREQAKKSAPTAQVRQKAPKQEEMFLSLVVPSYNVAPYIDQFLESVFNQSTKPKRFEVILVNDGSTDKTGEIIDSWQARYPDHIRVVHQENGGLSAARNAGLAVAIGKWVSFPDPDDFLDVDYFKHMMAETAHKQTRPLVAVVSKLIFYHEDLDEFADTHPLRYRYGEAVTRRRSHDLKDFMVLAVNAAWLRRETLVRHGLTFDGRVRPSFEDVHFFNRLLLLTPRRTVSFVRDALYYYRKRSDKSSLLDKSKIKPEWYDDQLRYGYLDLLQKSAELLVKVPRHIQRVCLYSTFWRFRHLVDHPERAAFLTDEQRSTFWQLLQEVFHYIDVETIEHFHLAGCTEEHKTALLALFKGQRRSQTAVYLEQVDPDAGMMQFSYFTGGDVSFDLRCLVNGVEVASFLPSRRTAHFLDMVYFRQNFFWLKLRDGDDVVFEREGEPCPIRRKGHSLGKTADWASLRNAVRVGLPSKPTAETKRLRAQVLARRDVYRGAMVLMDREDKADDNAEHLYRHLLATGRAANAWFVLRRESRDWPRLEAEGFKLLEFRSDEHIAAQMNAEFLISSHVDHFVLWPVARADFADLARYKFVFLQHGVTTNDLSQWLNSKPIRLFVTVMPDEYREIARPDGNYVFSEREVVLSGFPRHDALWAKGQAMTGDSILFIPTWRKYLTDEADRDGMRRGKVDHFLDSDYARNWLELLNSPRLQSIAEAHGLRIVFAPHPNIAMYLEDMDLPDHIQIVNVLDGASYQDLFARARIAVTCYSSAATEVAFLQRPLVYFQFDADQVFEGDHVWRRGSFSFETDGFGPVTKSADAALNRIEEALEGREDPVYASRRDAAFPFRDGQCCERVYQAIEGIRHR